jgi:hypothetical protein
VLNGLLGLVQRRLGLHELRASGFALGVAQLIHLGATLAITI